MEIILCFALSAVLGASIFLIAVMVRRFKPRLRPTQPSTTDLDTVDCDPDLEIVRTPLPEPQFLSSPPEPRYPTLGRGTRILRNSATEFTSPSPTRDNVVRYSTIGRHSRVSPSGSGVGSAPSQPYSSSQAIYAPGSTYSAGGLSNHSSHLDVDLADPRSLTLSHRSDLPLYD